MQPMTPQDWKKQKNRVAAQKSRDKKRNTKRRLERAEEEFTVEQRMLMQENEELRQLMDSPGGDPDSDEVARSMLFYEEANFIQSENYRLRYQMCELLFRVQPNVLELLQQNIPIMEHQRANDPLGLVDMMEMPPVPPAHLVWAQEQPPFADMGYYAPPMNGNYHHLPAALPPVRAPIIDPGNYPPAPGMLQHQSGTFLQVSPRSESQSNISRPPSSSSQQFPH